MTRLERIGGCTPSMGPRRRLRTGTWDDPTSALSFVISRRGLGGAVMAYLREVTDKCCQCRQKRATVELFTHENRNLGRYCRPCGEKQLKNELDYEKRRSQRSAS